MSLIFFFVFFFFNDTAPTEIYTLSLHDALPICAGGRDGRAAACSSLPGSGRYDRPMTARRELISGLAAVPLFSACSKRDLQIVARHTEVVEVPAGTAGVGEGGEGGGPFFVLAPGAGVRRRG